jgi:hypothetical protein
LNFGRESKKRGDRNLRREYRRGKREDKRKTITGDRTL